MIRITIEKSIVNDVETKKIKLYGLTLIVITRVPVKVTYKISQETLAFLEKCQNYERNNRPSIL